mgnify:CR=1 FL=1
MVITGTPGEVDGTRTPNGSGRGDRHNDRGNKLIAKYSFKGKMKDGPIFELTITETGHRPSQFKKIYDALPVFCADKNYGGLDEVLCTGRDKVEDDFMPAYPNANLWSNTHQIQVATVAAEAPLIDNRRACHYLRIGGTDNCHKRKYTKAAIIRIQT